MKDYIEERVLELANYIIETNSTVRATANKFRVSKSTVHKDVTERLLEINPALAHEVKEVLAKAEGVVIQDDGSKNLYPMALTAENKNEVFVGRIRKDLVFDNAITLWCCGDQVRKGAATNAIQIMEVLVEA